MTPQEVGTGESRYPPCRARRTECITAYLAATVTSVLLAVSLTRLVPRLHVSPITKDILGRLVPFASVASAGIVK